MRMIERWFPCAEVSEASISGWGSGLSEKALFTWFAARPLAQARAAVLASLLPWPENSSEQVRLQDLVRRALRGRDAAHDEVVAEISKHFQAGPSLLDPFSGRAMIPLEAARYGVKAWGIDYSPVATLAGALLADYPLRDWSSEPLLPFAQMEGDLIGDRLLSDVKRVLNEIGCRYATVMAEFYPKYRGKQPWGYVWAISLPCQECNRRFPLTGSLVLRHPLRKKDDPGQSYHLEVNKRSGTFRAVVHDGQPTANPTLVTLKKAGKTLRGKVAVCPFCEHPHDLEVHKRLALEGLGNDELLVAADVDPDFGKTFRLPTETERHAADSAKSALAREKPFDTDLPAVPQEVIPENNGATIRPQLYGAKTYGDLCNARQTLGLIRLSRIIGALGSELQQAGLSHDYTAALCGYAGAVLVRKLRRSTRGAMLGPRLDPKSNRIDCNHIFTNETSISFSYDYFETALGDGPATWPSLSDDTLAVLRNQASRPPGRPAVICRGSALSLPIRADSVDAVVTDPPYDAMVYYTDASDLFYCWLKRALLTTQPEFSITTDPRGLQEKAEELIVKEHGIAPGEHRTREFYNNSIAAAFAEAKRKVRKDGVVTIVFGHGEPEVWHRLLKALTSAGLFLTGSWPAKTEAGGQQGKANIVTTLTLACRPVSADRPVGRVNEVDAEVRQEVLDRVPQWDRAGLALTDQLMASAGPAMEVVGRYADVLDRRGNPVEPNRYLLLARRAVEEAAAIRIDELPLETFDTRTRFALFWSRLFGRALAPKSEARWQAMASDLSLKELDGILVEADKGKGVRLAFANEVLREVNETSSIIDIAFAMVRAWRDGITEVGEVLAAANRDTEDSHLWAALNYLASRLPEADPDRQAWMALVRTRKVIHSAARELIGVRRQIQERSKAESLQRNLFHSQDEENT
jgi:putative DNA methylase